MKKERFATAKNNKLSPVFSSFQTLFQATRLDDQFGGYTIFVSFSQQIGKSFPGLPYRQRIDIREKVSSIAFGCQWINLTVMAEFVLDNVQDHQGRTCLPTLAEGIDFRVAAVLFT